jgi:hypothetical protein
MSDSDHLDISLFIYLAVKLQLDDYVKSIAKLLLPKDQTELLTDMLEMAATEYLITHHQFHKDTPSVH